MTRRPASASTSGSTRCRRSAGCTTRSWTSCCLEAQGSTNLSVRCGFYDQAAEYIAKNYYGPFYFAFSPANISVHGVAGPGLTTPLASVAVVPTIPWEDVYYTPSS